MTPVTPEPRPCLESRCSKDAVGSVGGSRWWPLCPEHSLAYARSVLAKALAEHDALVAHLDAKPHPGQLRLVEG